MVVVGGLKKKTVKINQDMFLNWTQVGPFNLCNAENKRNHEKKKKKKKNLLYKVECHGIWFNYILKD